MRKAGKEGGAGCGARQGMGPSEGGRDAGAGWFGRVRRAGVVCAREATKGAALCEWGRPRGGRRHTPRGRQSTCRVAAWPPLGRASKSKPPTPRSPLSAFPSKAAPLRPGPLLTPTCDSDLRSAPRTMGVMSPPSVATAIATSTAGARTAAPAAPSHAALASGTSRSASATARTTQSFTLTFTPWWRRVRRDVRGGKRRRWRRGWRVERVGVVGAGL
jgi:hypothetical protein